MSRHNALFPSLVALLTFFTVGSACASSTEAAGTLHRFTSGADGFHTHSYYLDTGYEVVVFDAQFTDGLAEALIADIQRTTDSPITHLVVTHPNPDKFNGVAPFRALGAKVVASQATADAVADVHAYKKYYFVEIAKMFTNATYPAQATIDVTFERSLSLELRGGVVELRELDHPGVSSTQTVAWIPGNDAVVVGDLVHHRTHAWLEGGIVEGAPTPDLAAWKSALTQLGNDFGGATVYGGRGESAPVDDGVVAQIAYLDAIQTLIEAYLAGLTAEARAELSGADAAKHHKAIAERAAAAFPEYAHSYLVEYGVYGLVNALASK